MGKAHRIKIFCDDLIYNAVIDSMIRLKVSFLIFFFFAFGQKSTGLPIVISILLMSRLK